MFNLSGLWAICTKEVYQIRSLFCFVFIGAPYHGYVTLPMHKQVVIFVSILFIYLFGILGRFQHCTGHITTGSWKGRGNQYIQFVRVLYCKLPTNGKQLPAFPLETVRGSNPGLRGGRRECYHSATMAPISILLIM